MDVLPGQAEELHRLLIEYPDGLTPKTPWDFYHLGSRTDLSDEYVLDNLDKLCKDLDSDLNFNPYLKIETRLKIIDHLTENNFFIQLKWSYETNIRELPILQKFIKVDP